MTTATPTWELVYGLLVVLAIALLLLWWVSRRGGRRSRARNRHARDGERRAQRLLERAGYSIEAEQERALWWIEVDGEDVEIELRADFIVHDGDDRWLAEVKTGEVAPDPTSAATRRQLLEYALAFELGVLLVDVDAGVIQEVRFPRAGRRS